MLLIAGREGEGRLGQLWAVCFHCRSPLAAPRDPHSTWKHPWYFCLQMLQAAGPAAPWLFRFSVSRWDPTKPLLAAALAGRWMVLWQPIPCIQPCVGKAVPEVLAAGASHGHAWAPREPVCPAWDRAWLLAPHGEPGRSWGCAGITCPQLGFSSWNSCLVFRDGSGLQLH